MLPVPSLPILYCLAGAARSQWQGGRRYAARQRHLSAGPAAPAPGAQGWAPRAVPLASGSSCWRQWPWRQREVSTGRGVERLRQGVGIPGLAAAHCPGPRGSWWPPGLCPPPSDRSAPTCPPSCGGKQQGSAAHLTCDPARTPMHALKGQQHPLPYGLHPEWTPRCPPPSPGNRQDPLPL